MDFYRIDEKYIKFLQHMKNKKEELQRYQILSILIIINLPLEP